ncbi:unnamed protein product [Prorocentrum cordatum]|uniref:RING-type domain-containing protein n=1 Tax=Prorocentrum cordatum TaxID=2364126 RepID=A0ABN9VQC3_9DINO|nr:unnamed protein product [Polarella glacialis]
MIAARLAERRRAQDEGALAASAGCGGGAASGARERVAPEAGGRAATPCPICGEPMEVARYVKRLPCDHMFHYACIDDYHRCLVVIGADSNCEFGRRATGGGAVQLTADDVLLGTHNTGAENFTSQELWRLMSMEGLAVVDSFYATGPTYFGQDHFPLLWRLRYKLHFDVPDTELEPRWDHDCMAKLLSDEGSLGLIGELERPEEAMVADLLRIQIEEIGHDLTLRKLRILHLQTQKDMSNAFPSTSHDTLADVVGAIIPDLQDQQFLSQRHKEAAMEIRAGNETTYHVPQQGAGMGDGNACELFARSFARPLGDWSRALQATNSDSLRIGETEVPLIEASTLIECPCAKQLIDLYMRDYADDVSHTHPLPDDNRLRAAALASAPNTLLNDKLSEQGGFAQNADKEVALPVFVGSGGYTATRAVLSGSILRFHGVPQAQTEYLGGVEQPTRGRGAEIRARVDATRSAWCKLGRFWNQHTALKLERMAFLRVLHSAAYSGLETNILGKKDYNRRLRIANARTELLVRRIRYRQNLARYPEASAQAVAALFGHFPALQGHSIRNILTDYRIATAFGSIDPKGLRRAYWEQESNEPLPLILTIVSVLPRPFGLKLNFRRLLRCSNTYEKCTPLPAPDLCFDVEFGRAGLEYWDSQRAAPPGGRDVLTLADNHYGSAPADVQRPEHMPIEWIQATYPVLMRLALRRELSINHLEAAAFRHVEMPSKHEVVLSMQLTAKFYGQEGARLRKEHARQIQAGQLNHAALKEYERQIKQEKPDNSKLAGNILHCRMQTTRSGEFVKVWLAVEPMQIEQVIVDSLVQLGGKHKRTRYAVDSLLGRIPLESECGFSDWLDGFPDCTYEFGRGQSERDWGYSLCAERVENFSGPLLYVLS